VDYKELEEDFELFCEIENPNQDNNLIDNIIFHP